MTDVLPDPGQEFLAQDPLELTPAETEQVNAVESGHGVLLASVGIGAAYLAYRQYMKRKLSQEVARQGTSLTRKSLEYAVSAAWNLFVPRWVSMTAPYLLAGYIEGMQDAQAGTVPHPMLMKIAQGYAEELGNHINETSAQAMLSGFQAQVNRKVPPVMAAKRITDAYGVTQRPMNTLVNIWVSDEQAKLTDQVLPNAKADRAQAFIEAQQQLRARRIGDHEAWAARSQAKQIVWMWGVDKGAIPSTARRVWITAADERVCEICGPMNGVSAPVGEKFTTSDGQYWTPPTHINCRCDVALDLSVSEDIQDEITALLENESVSKARPGDPYDRDRRGQFARTESRSARPFKEREAEVDALLAQVNEALKRPVVSPPKVDKPDLGRPNLRGPNLSRPNLSPITHEPKLDRKLKHKLEREKLRINLGPDLHHALTNTPIPDEPIPTGDGTWEPLEHPQVAILVGWGDSPVDYSDGIYTIIDANQRFYEVYPDDSMPDKYERSLQKAIGEIWADWILKKQSEFYDLSPGERRYYDEDSGLYYDIDEESYTDALYEVVNNTPRIHSGVVELQGYGEFGDHTIKVTANDIANVMNLWEESAADGPQLMVVRHGMPGITGRMPDTDPGIFSNPGKWKLIGDASGERYLTHFPYQIHYAVPVDLDLE